LATYVLVPGAWLGGWAWKATAARLRQLGHDVYPVTLTGLGERVHLAQPEIDLETHIADVVNTISWEDLSDVILAGHSYAGFVVTGVADRIPERIAQVVYVDSAPAANGQAMTDFFPPEALAAVQRVVTDHGEGWRLPFPGSTQLGEQASIAGLDTAALALLDARATPHPWATYTQPLRLEREGQESYERVVIACDDIRGMAEAGIPPIVAMTKPPWRYLELDTGHWPMLSQPVALADLLAGLGEGR
jgi:pimeloyl-ACP methyl ester carboxylesterase